MDLGSLWSLFSVLLNGVVYGPPNIGGQIKGCDAIHGNNQITGSTTALK